MTFVDKDPLKLGLEDGLESRAVLAAVEQARGHDDDLSALGNGTGELLADDQRTDLRLSIGKENQKRIREMCLEEISTLDAEASSTDVNHWSRALQGTMMRYGFLSLSFFPI